METPADLVDLPTPETSPGLSVCNEKCIAIFFGSLCLDLLVFANTLASSLRRGAQYCDDSFRAMSEQRSVLGSLDSIV